MPYLTPERRRAIDDGAPLESPGDLNYWISSLCLNYWESKGESYATYNDILGAIEGAKLEAYRTLIGPYEASKALSNGALPGQTDVAWAAGFFDGEGNTNHTFQRRRDGTLRPKGRVQLSVAQKEPLLLLRFKEAVGGIGYIREMRATATRKFPIWDYQVTKFDDILHVARVLWPYLGVFKRQQALLALTRYAEERDLDLGLPASIEEPWPA